MAFPRLKAPLRKTAERAVGGLGSAIGQFTDTLTPEDCANFFGDGAYEPD